jgi:diacylglycerol kinase family enzyme
MNIPNPKKSSLFTTTKDIIENGKKIPLDTFYVNKVNTFYAAGMGIFANIPYITSQKLKKKIGEAAYMMTGFVSLFKKIPKFEIEVEVNGEKIAGTFALILITNSESIGGMGKILQNIDYSDKKFELTLLKYKNHMQVLKDLAKVILQRKDLSNYKNFYHFKTDKLNIKFLKATDENWCIDGEDGEFMGKGNLKKGEKNIEVKLGPSIDILIPNNEAK